MDSRHVYIYIFQSYLTSTSIYLWDRIKQLNTFGTWWSFHSSQNHIIQISSNIYIQTTCLLFHWWIDTVNIINQLVSVVKLKLNKYLVHILNSKKIISHSTNASLTSKRAFRRHESTDAWKHHIFFSWSPEASNVCRGGKRLTCNQNLRWS